MEVKFYEAIDFMEQAAGATGEAAIVYENKARESTIACLNIQDTIGAAIEEIRGLAA